MDFHLEEALSRIEEGIAYAIPLADILSEGYAADAVRVSVADAIGGIVGTVNLHLPRLLTTASASSATIDRNVLQQAAAAAVRLSCDFSCLHAEAVAAVLAATTARSDVSFWRRQQALLTVSHQSEVGLTGIVEAVAQMGLKAERASSVLTGILTDIETAISDAAQAEATLRGWASLQRGDGPMLMLSASPLATATAAATAIDVATQAAIISATQPYLTADTPRVAQLLSIPSVPHAQQVMTDDEAATAPSPSVDMPDLDAPIATTPATVGAVVEKRPEVLECDVVRFQNNKEKWVAFVGLLDGRPYEIFTGLQDEDEGIVLPKSVTKGRIIKQVGSDGTKRYDFQFQNKRGYKTTVEGLSEKFNPEYWNYAKLLSGVLRYGMPIDHVIRLVGQLSLQSESINTWKNGVRSALKRYIPDDDTPQAGG